MRDEGHGDEPTSDEITAEREELLAHLEVVERELLRREERVRQVSSDLVACKGKLESLSVKQGLRTGNASSLVVAESYRRRIQQEVEKKNREYGEAEEDARLARERKAMIEDELQMLDDARDERDEGLKDEQS